MSAATAEPEAIGEVEALVQQPDPAVLFVAKRDELRLVKQGRYPIMVPSTGQRIGETKGVVVSFAPRGEFRCPEHGKVTIMDPGGAGEATMYAHDTVDDKGETVQGLLNWLLTHRRCGDPNEGFVRLDPKAPPINQEEQQRIVDAATAWDVDTLEAIVEAERAGWGRDELVAVAQGAIEKIRESEDRVREKFVEEQEAARSVEDAQAGKLREAEARAVAAEQALEAALAEAKARPSGALETPRKEQEREETKTAAAGPLAEEREVMASENVATAKQQNDAASKTAAKKK